MCAILQFFFIYSYNIVFLVIDCNFVLISINGCKDMDLIVYHQTIFVLFLTF